MTTDQRKTLTVIAAHGLKVPREDNARQYITDDKAVTVAASAYYRRRLAAGDLVDPDKQVQRVTETSQARASGKSAGKSSATVTSETK